MSNADDSVTEEVIMVEEQNGIDSNYRREMHCTFKWNIKNFNSCKLEPGEELCSPIFNADSANNTSRWYLSVFPNGEKDGDDCVCVHIIRLPAEELFPDDTKFYSKISIWNSKNQTFNDERVVDFETLRKVQFRTTLKRTMLEEDSSVLDSDDRLSIKCRMCSFNEAQVTRPIASEDVSPQRSLKTFSNDLRTLYRSHKFSDVILKMEDGSTPSHKIILNARSSVFADLLESLPNRDEFVISDVSKNIMDILLSYIYTGEIDVESNVLISKLYDAAEKYNVVGLMRSITPSYIYATTEVINEPLSFTWRVRNFTNLNRDASKMIYSSKFGTDSTGLWSLSLYFRDENEDDENKIIGIYVNKLWTRSQKKSVFVQFKIHLVDQKDNPRFVLEMAKCFKQCDRFGIPSFLNMNVLLQERNELIPSDTLTIQCDMKVSDGTCLSKIVHSSSSSSANIHDISDVRDLSDCFRNLYVSKRNNDIIVTIDGSKKPDKTFSLHKTILCARSTKFADFFANLDYIPRPYTIDISGIKVEVLESLFLFIYTGELKNLTCDVAQDLYTAANHYNISDITWIISEYLISNLSVQNAFKMMILSGTLNDNNLKSMVIDFICSHAEQLITSTSQWSSFVREHREYSSEVLKSLADGYRESKKRRLN